MTKAELIRRFQWVPLVLPFAAAGGFKLFRAYAGGAFFVTGNRLLLIEEALIALYRLSDFAPSAWLLLTLACSIWTTHTVRTGAELSEKPAAVFRWAMAPVVFVLHVIFAAVVFGI